MRAQAQPANAEVPKRRRAMCKEGQELDSEQAKLLQLLNIKMARFQLTLRCRWTDGDFESYEM